MLHDPRDARGPAAAVIVDGRETPIAPPQQIPSGRSGPRRGFAAFVLLASLTSALAGGVVATAIQQGSAGAPAASPSPDAAPGGASAIVAAADAVLPAVVTIENRSAGAVGSGSGLVIDRTNGYIVTNSHVIERASSTRASSDLTVFLPDGRTMAATVVGHDPATDIAVLKVTGSLTAEAKLSKVARLPVGSAVIAIGTPGTETIGTLLSNTVTSGIVSATGRRLPRFDLQNVVLADLIQTDASIGPGMSGGPLVLVDTREVVGLMTLLVRGDANLGFAIPAATVIDVAERIIASDGQ